MNFLQRQTSYTVILISTFLILSWIILPLSPNNISSDSKSTSKQYIIPSTDGVLIKDIPYFWQEINGFCYWTAITMAMHKVGVPIDLYTFFAVSGIGFSNAYVRVNDTMMMLPGALFRQQEQLLPLCEFYGLSHELYINQNANWTPFAIATWSSWGVNITGISGQSEAFDILRKTIDDGFPVILWTDPYYLPAEDYDIARNLGIRQNDSAPEVGHAVLAIGYDDTDGTVQVMDPGVGSFGSNFGYPDDGRWNYSVDYTMLNDAWGAIGYGATILKPGNGTIQDFESRLGNHVVNRLLGNYTSYLPETEELSFISLGENAFRTLSRDMDPETIRSYIEELESAEERWLALLSMGYNFESMMTLQYLSYRVALSVLPDLMPNTDLSLFLEEGSAALSYMEVLSANRSLTDLYYLGSSETLLTSTFINIAMRYNSSGELETTLNSYSWQLGKISLQLIRIADAWKNAGEVLRLVLSGEDPNQTQPSLYVWLLPVGAAVSIGIVAIVAIATWKLTRND